ncbi:phosphorylase [filamentous cyanobacterium LEGE 11480]|uniref:Phosphorylase n=1 Tax=Romeriopsis navalis LEGE 11480 TaxID=2777977 RepID=A0A928Z4F8_9CYAN|nr:phosphorylase [Romeriopsis navalis]MBE9030200.1 phosphorylase [Romeriopsis navalis LEGE 11480]
MPTHTPLNIWQKTLDRTVSALASGALQSIPTHYEWLEDNGIQFLVRIVDNIRRKVEAKKEQKKRGPDFNPFLPYEEELFVTDLSPTHVALLNKFNVVEHHLLIITRAFESQESLLTIRDFEALWAVLREIDGFAFYNGGRLAGASQPHKHLQVIPLPFVPDDPQPHARLPIEPLIKASLPAAGVATVPTLPFQQAIAPLNLTVTMPVAQAAQQLQAAYHALLQACDMAIGDGVSATPAAGAYNLLATRDWMFLVPRTEEGVGKIGVNSLGFAGALLVKNEKQLQRLKQSRPIEILAQVGKSRAV